ncbi:hypothetical protein KUW09_23590 [Mameliella alba]|nr:hypothetical protein [Antarctobacter heliothermus]MBY6147056.1 hypothetical protein [Mameliella alba]MCA0957061.1 hypothetical protein [Mameliella alba]
MGQEKTGSPEDAAALSVSIKVDQPKVEPVEAPDAFLSGLSEDLKASDDVDADLARILSDHILTPTPQADAVANAKAAIIAVAAKRASPAEEQNDR